MSDTMIKYAGGTAAIEGFGTTNPQVAAFLQATFALDNMGINLSQANSIQAQSVADAREVSGRSL